MDYLDRLEENEERFRAMRRREPMLTAEPKPKHDITIIGVIRAVDGWYKCRIRRKHENNSSCGAD